jgi:hypothetical protein
MGSYNRLDDRMRAEQAAWGDKVRPSWTPGSRWRNRHTGTEDTIAYVGPCSNLDGRTRIWLKDEQARHKSNGWDTYHFDRCWEKAD